MSTCQYSERLEVTLARSRAAELAVAAAALATLALAYATPLPLDWQVAAVTWIGANALRALGRLRAPSRLAVDAAGEVAVDGRAGVLRDGSFVAPWLTVLRWRPAHAWWDRTLLLTPGMLPAADFRHLRVLLKFGDRPVPVSGTCGRAHEKAD